MAIRRGDVAKATVTDTIVKAFGDNVTGIVDKKIYVNIPEGQDIVQIAISLTMPKIPIAATEVGSESNQGSTTPQVTAPASTELSPEDKAAVDKLMKSLGITD